MWTAEPPVGSEAARESLKSRCTDLCLVPTAQQLLGGRLTRRSSQPGGHARTASARLGGGSPPPHRPEGPGLWAAAPGCALSGGRASQCARWTCRRAGPACLRVTAGIPWCPKQSVREHIFLQGLERKDAPPRAPGTWPAQGNIVLLTGLWPLAVRSYRHGAFRRVSLLYECGVESKMLRHSYLPLIPHAILASSWLQARTAGEVK